jgi:DNA-binding transcriptional LysR family regulator
MTRTIDDYDLMLRMVAAGLGVGFVPELALSFSDTAVVLRTRPAASHRCASASMRSARHAATSTTVQALLSGLDWRVTNRRSL